MAISKCISLSDENRIVKNFADAALHVNETGYHGTPEFPVAVYLDDVSNQYVNWHWHEEFEIGFVTEGTVLFGCGSRNYLLDKGDIFFVNSNILHSMCKANPEEATAVFKSIAFHSSLICDSVNSIFYRKYLLPILSNNNFREYIITKEDEVHERMLTGLSKAWDLVYSEPSDYEIDVRNELSSVFCVLNRIQEELPKTESAGTHNYLPEKRVQLLLDYIHKHYNSGISIEDLARTASISKTEVLRCFKSIMGVSPISYLNSYRLQRAALMLLNTDKNIQEIAADCGFEDNSYFSKLFRKKYHVTPHDYRCGNAE